MSDFSELLQEAEKLTANIEGVSELPKIDRSLRQVLQDSQELFQRVARSGAQDVQANLLLGSQGIDLPRIVQKLDNISAKQTFEPLKPTVDTDVHSYLQNEIQNIIISVIEENFKKSSEAAKNKAWEHEKSEWTQERLKILNSMMAPSRDVTLLGKQPSLFMELPPQTSTALGNQEAIYASKIAEYNKSLTRGHIRMNLIVELAKAAQEFSDTKVNDMWEIMKYMTELPAFPYNENVIKVRNTKPVIKAIVGQAKRYLEDRYKTFMTNVINENLAEARRGGVPGTLSLAKSFVGIRLQGQYIGLQGGSYEDKPLWPVVYYCLRSGDLNAAIQCLKQATVDVKSIIKLLETKFKNPEGTDIVEMERNLQFEYRRVVHNSTDPFQRIVYDVLCCCDKSDEHSEIAKTADDYLWLKLSFLRFNSEKDDSEAFRNLQATILEEYGESHYDAMNQPHLYFQMLALTGQFEAAFEFLARVIRYQIHGAQMAIALNELHILALPSSPIAPLLSIDIVDPKPTRRLNLTRLIMIYIQQFELKAPKESVQYLFMLRNIVDEQKHKIFIKCVVNLILEVHDYDMFFGKMQKSGVRSHGFLDDFVTDDIKLEDIARGVGQALIERGSLEDAVDLFDLANNQEEVLSLLRTLLSQFVHHQSTDGSLRQRLPVKVNEVANRYSAIGYNCSASSVSSFLILKNLLVFFDQYHAKQYALALKTIEDIRLIPLQINEVDERVNTFRRLSTDVTKVVPDVLLATMNILFDQFQKVKSHEYIPHRLQEASQDTQLGFIQEQAKAITSFSGLLPYNMPGDLSSRLMQLEILMH